MNGKPRYTSIYTFVPSGNIARAEELLGLGRDLLEIAEEDRARLDFPFFSKRMMWDNGQSDIRVMASKDHNSRIDIFTTADAQEDKNDYRVRLLHCRIELTLSADLAEDPEPDDGTVGWPYQKDPSFIAVEPIPVMEGDDNKIYLHTLFEIDSRHGIIIEGVNNSERHIENFQMDATAAVEGDEGRRLPIDDVKSLIEARTGYKYVEKVLDDSGEAAPVFDKPLEVIFRGSVTE